MHPVSHCSLLASSFKQERHLHYDCILVTFWIGVAAAS